jgi:hypothetical protein
MFGRRKKRRVQALEAVAGASAKLVQNWAETDDIGKSSLVRNIAWTLRMLEREENEER